MQQSKQLRLEATISGRVQGVSFRYYTRSEAVRLGVTGWVKNARDGTVLIAAEGSKRRLTAFREYLNEGPPAARVDGVEVRWTEGTGEFGSFEIRWI